MRGVCARVKLFGADPRTGVDASHSRPWETVIGNADINNSSLYAACKAANNTTV